VCYVNFTNILCTDFTRADPKCAKMTVKLSLWFYAIGICMSESYEKLLLLLYVYYPKAVFSLYKIGDIQFML